MVGKGTSNQMSKFFQTFYLNSSFDMTSESLITFNFFILFFFSHSLLIFIFLVKKKIWILDVKVKWDATIAMLLDWLCNIFTFVTIHSPSPIHGLKPKDLERLSVKTLSSKMT